jgi:DNA invertase Pin-like site-specific DNA recombinase
VDKNAPKAIGYIRVSTELQAADGISLDAQRESIEDYCNAHKLNLIAIYQDDHTGKTLNRKGFQAALEHMKQSGAVLVGVKLDRITRNVGDLDYLLKTYFGDGKAFALRLVQFPVDTSSSIGRLILNIICSVAQWEREEICARTQMGLNYLKKLGVYLGGAPYGKQYSEDPDAYGRRVLLDDPAEQATIQRLCDLFDGGQSLHKIVKVLAEEGHKPRGKGKWTRIAAARILHRAGRVTCQPWDRSQAIRDKEVVGKRILELRADGLNLSEIGRQLTRENLMPVRGSKWYAATVNAYLSERASHDRQAIVKLALSLREAGRTLSEIGAELTLRGYTPLRGGRWYPAQIKAILDLNHRPDGRDKTV